MINLLPPYQKIKIDGEKKWKCFSLFSFFVLVFFIFLSFYLYLITVFSHNFLKIENDDLNKEKIELSFISEKEEKIIKFNKIFSDINYFQNETLVVTDVLMEIYEILPNRAYIKSFQFDRKMDEKNEREINQVILSGYSPDWQSLLEIEDGLKNSFLNVKFSPGSWTEIKNINFLVSFEI